MRTITRVASTLLIFGATLMAQAPERRSIERNRPVHMIEDSVPGRLVVQHRLGANNTAINHLFSKHGATVRMHHTNLSISVINVDPSRRDEIAKDLEDSGLFNFVEPDYVGQEAATPNDPGFPQQWHLNTIQAPRAWNITTGSSKLK